MNDDGIVVVTLRGGPIGMRAFVILAVSGGSAGAVQRNESALVEIARDMGAKTLAFRSDRRGWARALSDKWRRTGDFYERTV